MWIISPNSTLRKGELDIEDYQIIEFINIYNLPITKYTQPHPTS
jgi:ABC-type metal ion transport system substrate-binding protein